MIKSARAGGIAAARHGTDVDMLLGIGGTPEGIITACAIKAVGGVIQGRLAPKDDEAAEAISKALLAKADPAVRELIEKQQADLAEATRIAQILRQETVGGAPVLRTARGRKDARPRAGTCRPGATGWGRTAANPA